MRKKKEEDMEKEREGEGGERGRRGGSEKQRFEHFLLRQESTPGGLELQEGNLSWTSATNMIIKVC